MSAKPIDELLTMEATVEILRGLRVNALPPARAVAIRENVPGGIKVTLCFVDNTGKSVVFKGMPVGLIVTVRRLDRELTNAFGNKNMVGLLLAEDVGKYGPWKT
jgi:hypothetical protein